MGGILKKLLLHPVEPVQLSGHFVYGFCNGSDLPAGLDQSDLGETAAFNFFEFLTQADQRINHFAGNEQAEQEHQRSACSKYENHSF
ncbi:hypothetical protein D3C75_1022420 [compost metagenome]